MARRICSFPGCSDPHQARGWCNKHVKRWRHHGDPAVDTRDPVRRFWEKVDKRGPDECWLWMGAQTSGGYGTFWVEGKPNVRAHRFSYALANGPIPDGTVVDHRCDVHLCVNPAHLRALGNRENIMRGTSVAAVHARQTHCKHGHPFDEANTRWWRGWRFCRACEAARTRRRYHKRRERLLGQGPQDAGRESGSPVH